jgi:hypothetical protein
MEAGYQVALPVGGAATSEGENLVLDASASDLPIMTEAFGAASNTRTTSLPTVVRKIRNLLRMLRAFCSAKRR